MRERGRTQGGREDDKNQKKEKERKKRAKCE